MHDDRAAGLPKTVTFLEIFALMDGGRRQVVTSEVPARDLKRAQMNPEEDGFYYFSRMRTEGAGTLGADCDKSAVVYYGRRLTPEQAVTLWNRGGLTPREPSDLRVIGHYPYGAVLLSGNRCLRLGEHDVVLDPAPPLHVSFLDEI